MARRHVLITSRSNSQYLLDKPHHVNPTGAVCGAHLQGALRVSTMFIAELMA